MASYIMKTLIEHEFNKVIKEFSGSDKDEQNGLDGIYGEDLAAELNRQAATEKDRKVRQAKFEKEREEARQKIRDKYNIKKKDDSPTTTKNQQRGKINDRITRIDNVNAKSEKNNGSEPQGFQPAKMKTGAFNSLKQKFGWK